MNSFGDVMRNLDWSVITNMLMSVIPALVCITLHELSHGYVAYKLGDNTAKSMGRLTLNPIKHIDIVGLIMMVAFKFGWAKPVPVDMRNFKHPKRDMAITALTGTPVRRDIAMTGEISLRGRVMPIGGLKEKTMAAMRNGVGTVIIPADNEPDLDEIDPMVRKALNFVLADRVDTVLETALAHKDAENKPDVILPVSGKKSRPGIRQ